MISRFSIRGGNSTYHERLWLVGGAIVLAVVTIFLANTARTEAQVAVNVRPDGCIENIEDRNFTDPFEIRTAVNSAGRTRGLTYIPDVDRGSAALHQDAATAHGACQVLGFTGAISFSGASRTYGSRDHYASCGDNRMVFWDSSRGDFVIRPACGNNHWIGTLTCRTTRVSCPAETPTPSPSPRPPQPTPTPTGCFCSQIYDPVCGADNRTYSNTCTAGCAGVPIKHRGQCQMMPPVVPSSTPVATHPFPWFTHVSAQQHQTSTFFAPSTAFQATHLSATSFPFGPFLTSGGSQLFTSQGLSSQQQAQQFDISAWSRPFPHWW